MSKPCRLLLVDDHAVVRFGVRQMLGRYQDIVVVDEACTASEGLEKAKANQVDVVLTDIGLPDYTGITLISQINKRWPDTKTIVFSMHSEEQFGMRAVMAGASGYLVKSRSSEQLCEAVRHVFRGGTYFSDYIRNQMLCRGGDEQGNPQQLRLLSEREMEVMYLMGQGLSSAEIASNLNRSIKTIDAHREHIKKKLKLRNATELIRFAVCWVEGHGHNDFRAA